MINLKLLVDENIPRQELLSSAFSSIVTKSGRAISSGDIAQADILLVRSVTQVNQSLLESCDLKFVGSTTIGLDHIDKAYLSNCNIPFAHAPGCNANAVVDYVMAALLEKYNDADLLNKTVGIVGHGQVGSRLAGVLQRLGIAYKAYDPLIAQDFPNAVTSIDEVLACDVVSLHVPLSHEGPHATQHLIDKSRLANLKSNALLINSCRGPVIDNQALLELLQSGCDFDVVLDVWEQEPAPDPELIESVFLATPHIAGYSYAGKIRGLQQVIQALASTLAIDLSEVEAQLNEDLSQTVHELNDFSIANIRSRINSLYSIKDDSRTFKQTLLEVAKKNRASLANSFDQLRKHYPLRHEHIHPVVLSLDN